MGTTPDFIGGLVGDANGGSITNSFWDKETSGLDISAGGGTGKTTAQMKSLATFQISEGVWDIAGDSAIDPDYPFLALGDGDYKTTWVIGTKTAGPVDPVDPVDPPSVNEQQQAAQTFAQNTVTHMVGRLTGGTATPTGAPIALTTPLQTPAGAGGNSIGGISGGINFVEVAGDGGSSTSTTTGSQSGRDASGFMNVFVVRGGVNYGASSSDDN